MINQAAGPPIVKCKNRSTLACGKHHVEQAIEGEGRPYFNEVASHYSLNFRFFYNLSH